jgi:hypothetical protein
MDFADDRRELLCLGMRQGDSRGKNADSIIGDGYSALRPGQ